MKGKLFLYGHLRSKPEMTYRTGNPIIFLASTYQDDSNELACVEICFERNGKRDRTFDKKFNLLRLNKTKNDPVSATALW